MTAKSRESEGDQAVDYEAFRAEVRSFMEENLTEAMRAAGRFQTSAFPNMEQATAWQRIRNERGWGAPSWPVEHGGTGWDLNQQQIYREESYRASAPTEHLQSVAMCGPCLIGHGSKEQKDYYLPRILSAEHIWCQGYSEPGSGSDLASLSTSAVSDGDVYIVNGSKIWTSNAHDATHMFCLVRTCTEEKPQQGISFLLIDMSTPGITIEPILNLNRIHEQNTVFFDNVRVPKANRVGEENQGWTVAKYLLEFERGGISVSPELRRNMAIIRNSAEQETTAAGKRLIDDRVFRRKLAQKEIELRALEITEDRIRAIISAGQSPGFLALQMNVVGMELFQSIDKLALEAAGIHALPDQFEVLEAEDATEANSPDYAITAMPRYLDGRAGTIAGGSSEVQRNIIAKTVLGL